MFEQSLVESTHRVGRRKPATILVSMAVQLAVLGVAVILPLLYYNVLPAAQLISFLSAPPPPAPPPPPPARVEVQIHKMVSEIQNNQLVAPPRIPPRIDYLTERAAPPDVNIGSGAGVDEGMSSLMSAPVSVAPLPPAAAPAATQPVAMSSSVVAARCLSCPAPAYPTVARGARIHGDVLLHILIGEDGSVKRLEVVGSPNVLLAAAAGKAVQAWRYSPLVLDDQPTEIDATVTVKFNLSGQ